MFSCKLFNCFEHGYKSVSIFSYISFKFIVFFNEFYEMLHLFLCKSCIMIFSPSEHQGHFEWMMVFGKFFNLFSFYFYIVISDFKSNSNGFHIRSLSLLLIFLFLFFLSIQELSVIKNFYNRDIPIFPHLHQVESFFLSFFSSITESHFTKILSIITDKLYFISANIII